jgi:predicted transcriptional regulator of viral defense system
MKKSASAAIIERLALENRRVLSDWRATLLLRRATAEISLHERRWSQAPRNVHDISPLLSQMVRRGEIKPLPRLPHLYEVTVPYARTGLVEEPEILMEVHPYAALSHLSALVFHDLTGELSKTIFAMIPADGTAGMLPPGTDAKDWKELTLIPARTPARILNRRVHWMRTTTDRYFGTEQYRPHGFPIRATTPERTLLDGLQQPELCGGVENVLRAWVLARDILDLDALTGYVDRLDIQVLRQRVGFILDELGLTHPTIERWRIHTNRGGSSKLLASAPYAPTFSESWDLSINVPVDVLREGAA